MKLTCDLCGGALQMDLGGQGATCTGCGLGYTMARLREKLGGPNLQKQKKPSRPIPEKTEGQKKAFSFVPKQFVMENTGHGVGDLSGRVQQGGIGLGDDVYIDGDYAHPYKVHLINDNPYMTCAKEGMPAELFLVKCPRKVLKNARRITGAPNPVANSYNYPGTVEDYFSNLLRQEFPQYEIREAVPCDELTIPASYMLCQEGKPVAAVFLIHSNSNAERYQAEKAVRVLGAKGIGCTHFFENYRNDAPYVIRRVQEALSGAAAVSSGEDEPVILDVLSTKKRMGMAWGTAMCRVRQGTIASGMPYHGHINTPGGDAVPLGSLHPGDVAAGGDVNMLLYCPKEMLPTIKTLYVFPDDDGDDEE